MSEVLVTRLAFNRSKLQLHNETTEEVTYSTGQYRARHTRQSLKATSFACHTDPPGTLLRHGIPRPTFKRTNSVDGPTSTSHGGVDQPARLQEDLPVPGGCQQVCRPVRGGEQG
jgi:hypothetical protein